MGPEFYRARAAEAMRKARADLFNSHIYREIACCYERLAAGSDETVKLLFCKLLFCQRQRRKIGRAPATTFVMRWTSLM